MTKEEFYIEIDKLGVKRDTARSYIHFHKDMNYEDVLNYYKNKEKSFRQKCIESGKTVSNIYQCRSQYKDLTDEQLIDIISKKTEKANRDKEIKVFCDNLGITIDSFKNYCNKHPELPLEDVMQYYKDKNTNKKPERVLNSVVTSKDLEGLSLRKMSEIVGINYTAVSHLREAHPELTNAEAAIVIRDKKLAEIKKIEDRLKEVVINTEGIEMRIIEYINSNNITVQFSDGAIKKGCMYNNFKKGKISHPKSKVSKFIGMYKMMNCGIGATVIGIDYNTEKVTVRFDDGLIKESNRNNFLRGNIKHPDYNAKSNKARENNKDLIGEKNVTKYGEQIEIIDALSQSKILIRFDNGVERWTTYSSFKNGTPQSKKHTTKSDDYTFKDYCKDRGLAYNCLEQFALREIKGVAKLKTVEDFDKLLEMYNNNKRVTFVDKLKAAGLIENNKDRAYYRIKTFRSEHMELTEEQVIEMFVTGERYKNNVFIHNAIEYSSRAECLRQLGISYTLFKNRKNLRKELNDNQIIDLIIKSREDSKVVVNGKTYKNVADACKNYELDANTIRTHSKNNNITVEDSINYFINKEKLSIIIHGTEYSEIIQICKKLDIDYKKFIYYKSYNKMSVLDTILHFRPDLYINAFGEIVDINGD